MGLAPAAGSPQISETGTLHRDWYTLARKLLKQSCRLRAAESSWVRHYGGCTCLLVSAPRARRGRDPALLGRAPRRTGVLRYTHTPGKVFGG